MSFKHNLVLTSALASSLCFGASAWAQDQNNASTLDEVVVTAQKRTENLQEVPVAVTAFSSQQRDEIGILTVQDVANFTPGMSYSDSPSRIYIRGIGRTSESASTDPGVGIYYDGVYSVNAAAIASPPMIVDRIEVLRGPQGTLYGKNTNGGAVNIITKRPTDDLTGEVRVEVGNYQTVKVGGTVSGPISDRLRYRATVKYDWQGDGYSKNLARPDDSYGGNFTFQGQLEADVTDNLQVWAKYAYAYTNVHSTPGAAIGPYDTVTPSFNSLTPNPLLGYGVANPAFTDHRTFAHDTPDLFRGWNQTFTLQADWDLGFASLRYIGGYAKSDAHITVDYDNSARNEPFEYAAPDAFLCPILTGGPCMISPVNIIDIDAEPQAYSNEINLFSNTDNRFRWVAGLYQYSEESSSLTDIHAPFQAELLALPNNPTGSYISVFGGSKNLTLGAFGQVDYDLNDTWTLQAGLRYTYDEKEVFSKLERLVYFLAPYAGAIDLPAPPESRAKRNFDGVTGKLALQWKPDEDTNVFALVARGYKSGVITDAGPPAVVIPPEELWDFEVGMKKDFGSTLRMNLAAFYYDYKNMQVQTNGEDPNLPGNFVQVWISAPKARSYGFEAESTWKPTENLEVLLSYSYLNATIRDLTGVVDFSVPPAQRVAEDVSGNDLPQSPRHKLALNVGYTWNFEPGSLKLSGTYVYTSKKYYDIFEKPVYAGRQSDLVNLRAIWTTADQKTRVIGYVANLFDKEYVNYVSLINATSYTSNQLNPPRTFGVEFQRQF